jgi:hypothetical protein
MAYTSIFVGIPGKAHDSYVFKRSPLYVLDPAEIKKIYPDEDLHLVGDLAYPLLPYLMKGFPKSIALSPGEKAFCEVLSACRSDVERSYSLLKNRNKWLQYLNVGNHEKAADIVSACCVLQNFAIKLKDVLPEEDEEEEEDDTNTPVYNDAQDRQSVLLAKASAKRLRLIEDLEEELNL